MSINTEDLRRATQAAKDQQDTDQEKSRLSSREEKRQADDRLYNSILAGLEEKLNKAAGEGKNTATVWEMGDFGHTNSDEVVDSIPMNMGVMLQLQSFCEENGLTTEIRKVETPERFTTYISYSLIVSW